MNTWRFITLSVFVHLKFSVFEKIHDQRWCGHPVIRTARKSLYLSHYLWKIILHLSHSMAPHSSTLAWKIPWMEEPGRLQSMGSLSWTRLSDFTFTFRFHALEKEMATHSSVLALRIPGSRETGGLPSMGLHSQTWLKWLSNSNSFVGKKAMFLKFNRKKLKFWEPYVK